jgi:hypothetical protein
MRHAALAWLTFGLLGAALALQLRALSDPPADDASLMGGDVLALAGPRVEPELAPPHVLALPPHFDEIAARPLFEPTRRPRVEAAPAPRAAPPPAPPPALSLLAIVREGERRVALVAPQRGGEATALEVDDTLQGWRVEAIDPGRVTLQRGKRNVVLHLRPEGAGTTRR